MYMGSIVFTVLTRIHIAEICSVIAYVCIVIGIIIEFVVFFRDIAKK